MPIITCPNCGAERLVVEGKKKNCRKCGTSLSTNPPKPKPPVKTSADELAEQYPEQIAEITQQVKAAAMSEAGKAEFGKLTSELLLECYPELVAELVAAAKELAVQEATEAAGEQVTKVVEKIAKLSAKKFAAQFPVLYNKVAAAIAKNKQKDQN